MLLRMMQGCKNNKKRIQLYTSVWLKCVYYLMAAFKNPTHQASWQYLAGVCELPSNRARDKTSENRKDNNHKTHQFWLPDTSFIQREVSEQQTAGRCHAQHKRDVSALNVAAGVIDSQSCNKFKWQQTFITNFFLEAVDPFLKHNMCIISLKNRRTQHLPILSTVTNKTTGRIVHLRDGWCLFITQKGSFVLVWIRCSIPLEYGRVLCLILVTDWFHSPKRLNHK